MANIFTKDFWRFGSATSVVKNSTDVQLRSANWSANSDIETLSKVFGISLSGINVTEQTALTIPAVLRCLELRGDAYASMPLRVHEYTDKGAKVDNEHTLDYVLSVRPNRYQTPSGWKKTMSIHRDIFGWGISAIERKGYRTVSEVRILQPSQYTIYETAEAIQGKREYTIVETDGTLHREEDLVIWRGMSTDGFHCRGIVGCLKEVIKTGLTTREFINKYYENGTFIGGILTTEKSLKPDEAEKNKKSWQSRNSGVSNAGGTAVLTDGLKFQPITNTLVDSQLVPFLELDNFQIYRAFGVPPHLVGDTTKATSFGSGLESQTTGFYTLTLRPGAVSLEEEISYKCLKTSEQKTRYVKFNFNSLLRADFKTRMEGYAIGRQNGWLNANDIRELEEMSHVEGGEKYLVNGTMIPVEMAGQQYNTNSDGNGTQNTSAK